MHARPLGILAQMTCPKHTTWTGDRASTWLTLRLMEICVKYAININIVVMTQILLFTGQLGVVGPPVVLLGLIVLSKRMMKAFCFLPTGDNGADGDDDDDYGNDAAITNDDEDLQ